MTPIDKNELLPAIRYVVGLDTDVRAVSALAPHILAQSDYEAAYSLLKATPDESMALNSWLPEALVLFNTPGLSEKQKQVMNEKIFKYGISSDPAFQDILSDCNARIGRYGFSFPQWRYIAQKFDDSSLIERYGMQRLTRETDTRDPALPDPARDRFGVGFVWSDETHYVEYRRAYIVVADLSENPAALVIRNSSYFFGRDRLPAPAYVSWQRFSGQQLQGLTENALEKSGHFLEWQNGVNVPDYFQLEHPHIRVTRVRDLLDYLDNFDAHLANWLHKPNAQNNTQPFSNLSHRNGFEEFLGFLKYKAANPGGGPPGSPFIGTIDSAMPPWFPEQALPLTQELVDRLEMHNGASDDELQKFFENASQPGKKLILLTGKNGDFPIAPKMKVGQQAAPLKKLTL